jgi:hypothetical protein
MAGTRVPAFAQYGNGDSGAGEALTFRGIIDSHSRSFVISGISSRTSSTSAGPSLLPATLILSSERPSRKKWEYRLTPGVPHEPHPSPD